jgi:hypothetical protein
MIASTSLLAATSVSAETIHVLGNPADGGLRLLAQGESGIELRYQMGSFTLEPLEIHGRSYQKITLPEVFLPSTAGSPDLPGMGRFVALPEGAEASVEIVSATTRTYHGVDVSPAPVIPTGNDDSPLVYEENPSIYGSRPVRFSSLKFGKCAASTS